MKFGFLKFGFYRFAAATLFTIGILASDGYAQNLDILSGQGRGLQQQLQQAQQNYPTAPNVGNFSQNQAPSSTAVNPFSEMFKKAQQKQVERPNFFQRLNSKSKDFFSRTKGWGKGKGVDAREKSETWNNVIRDFKVNEARLRQQAAEQATIPAQPNFRTAESIGEPKLRF